MAKKRNVFKLLIKFLILLLIIAFLFFLTGCKNNKQDEDINKKTIQELDYLDTKIVSILNTLNNITLRNYTLSKEEVQKEEKNQNSESSNSSNDSKEDNADEQKESNSQVSDNSKKEETNITVTSMEPNSILSNDKPDIDWNLIKQDIEMINEAWSIILLDLNYLNVNKDDISNFSTTLNDTLISIKEENKSNTLLNCSNLYSYIPKYEKQLKDNTEIQNIKQVKSYLLNAYSSIEQDDWVNIEKNISSADETFKKIINDNEYMKNKEFKVNRTYILLKELQNSLKYKDKDIFYLKYKNLIESLNTL